MIMILFCLSETFLDSSISNDDESINIIGYNLPWADHPSNVCMCHKEQLPIMKRNYLCTLKECLVTEIIADIYIYIYIYIGVCVDHQVRLKMILRGFVMN